MGMLVLAGEYMNALSRATFSSSPSAHASFPFSELADGDPGTIGKFGSLTAAPTITADLDLLGGIGMFESWTGAAPDGWTEANAGTGDVTQQSVSGSLVHSGLFSARFAAGDTSASAYVDLVVRAGQRLAFTIALSGDGGLGAVTMSIRNQQTGNYLNGGAWASASNEVITGPTTAAYSVFDPTTEPTACVFDVEGFSAVGGPLTTIRIQLLNDRATTIGWADSFAIWPVLDFVSIHGHNIDPRSAPVLRASTDNFSSSNVSIATLTLARRAFYATFTAAVLYRYWRLAFADTNSAAIWIGEWVLGRAHELTRGPNYPLRRNFSAPRISLARSVGAAATVTRGTFEQGTVPMTFRCSAAQRLDFYNEVYVRSLDGAPAVVVPSTLDADVFYGILGGEHGEEWQLRTSTRGYLDYSAAIDELALPLVTD